MAAAALAYVPRTLVATAVRACAANELEVHPMRVRGWSGWREGLLPCRVGVDAGTGQGGTFFKQFFFLNTHTRGAARGSGCDAAGAGRSVCGATHPMPLEGGAIGVAESSFVGDASTMRSKAGRTEWSGCEQAKAGETQGAVAAAQVGRSGGTGGATPQRCVSINDMHQREDVGWSAHG